MTNHFHGRVPTFAVALVAAAASAAFAASYASAGGLQAAEQFVQPFLKTFSGSSTGPIVVTHNKSTGPSLQGTSDQGNGIVGQTKLNNGFTGATAVVGQDLGTTGAQSNAGVGGTSVEGTGVFGTSTGGAGISGSSNSSVGVNGFSLSSYGVAGTSTSGVGVTGGGVVGVSGSGSAQSIVAYGQGGELYQGVSNSFADVFDVADNGSVSATSLSATGEIIGGTASTFHIGVVGYGPVYGVFGSATNTPAGGAGVGAQSTDGNIFVGYNSSSQVYSVDQNGNVIISGQIYTSGFCSAGCAKTGDESGRHIVSFTPAESEQTTEDFGSGQLRDGVARVQIASDFANTIDKHANYMVFLSPEGDTRGLFVTDKTPNSFVVHENQGGRATVSFSYRIVAKPYGVAQQRLPMINIPAAPHIAAEDLHKPVSLGRLVPRPAKIPRPIIHQ
ncbi:MAG TPA: hypothetical protein VID19_09495 [Candidatus Eremiobacteraceae bacterium]|jgi:hypothetical protein